MSIPTHTRLPERTLEELEELSLTLSQLDGKKVSIAKITRYALYRLLEEVREKKINSLEPEFWQNPNRWVRFKDQIAEMKTSGFDITKILK